MEARTMRTWLFAALATLSVTLPARAGIVTFEDVSPTCFAGSSITSGGFDFASEAYGFSCVDSDAAFAFPPTNSTGQFLSALNADVIIMTLGGGDLFYLKELDISFVQPQVPLSGGLSAGQLWIVADSGYIGTFDFGLSDDNGNWGFFNVHTDDLYQTGATAVGFLACVYDGSGGCSFDDPLAQFAIDNIRVPEPGSMLLVAVGLGLVAASRRRRVA